MGETIRIRATPLSGEKYIKVPIQQDFDFIKILSLKISQDDVYPQNCADYGMVVGRVTVNGGLGVPNAKVSIFIPLSTDDESNPIISSIYPYKTYQDKNENGLRYNLLPKNRQNKCHVPVGSFPSKREVLDNNDILEIFDKYYKYTTSTNKSGDYMICGIPTGSHDIHVDVDLSDIGMLTQRPHDLMRNGAATVDTVDTPTKFKTDTDLNRLPQIITENNSLDILPFWGDVDQCDVGINRYDIDLPYRVEPVAYFIGSIFTDQEKNSVNKNCRPRKGLGEMSRTTTGEGTIEMIRKTLNNRTEYFTVDGGRNIDEDGSWVLPVPMNLEYIVTDEFGDIIPSEDPRKGLATKAKVRFRIGMDNTGDEGRLRTRAKFLVPNNPPANTAGDYSFGEETSDSNFVELLWNNIYTVRNFIPRVQKMLNVKNPVETRQFIGIKKVDDCETYTEFPYNRADSKANILYIIICLIMTFVLKIVGLINNFLIRAINWMIHALNWVLKGLCEALGNFSNWIHDIGIEALDWYPFENVNLCMCTPPAVCPSCCGCLIGYVAPITWECNDITYVPGYEYGCTSEDGSLCNGYYVINCGDYVIENATNLAIACVQAQLADELNVYKFDFYNDWINGTLYAFLFKYKEKRKGKIKYCAYDCADWYPSWLGGQSFPDFTDGNADGVADNSCNRTYQLDTCAMGANSPCSDPQISQLDPLSNAMSVYIGCENVASIPYTFKEGLIKRQNSNLYYASASHNGFMKLFATDITLLGSANEWNLFGTPMIHQFLIPTTYQLPPSAGNNGDLQFQKEDGTACLEPVLFFLNCSGIKLFKRNCKNIRLICEIGRGLDENKTSPYDYFTGNDSLADGVIDDKEIENEFVRYSLRHMNVTGLTISNPEYDWHNYYRNFSGSTSLFGFGDAESVNVNNGFNGLPYNNSYYFYFGLHNGKTSLDKLNNQYLTDCDFVEGNDFIISYTATNVTTTNGFDGTINVSIEGGAPAYIGYVTYNGQILVGYNGISFTNDLLMTQLGAGTYTIKVIDNNGWIGTITVVIIGPAGLEFGSSVTNLSGYNSNNGVIYVNYINGGQVPYLMTLVGPSINPVTYTHTCSTQGCGDEFENLPAGIYTLTVSDNDSPQNSETVTLTINQPTQLVGVVLQQSNLTCYQSNNGILSFSGSGGMPPYTITVTDGTSTYNTFSLSNLPAGTYNAVITDMIGQTWLTSVPLTQPAEVTFTTIKEFYHGYNVSCFASSDGKITINAAGGTGTYTYFVGTVAVPSIATGLASGTHSVHVVDSNGCTSQSTTINLSKPALLTHTAVETDVTCYGANNGSITITYNGGTIAYPTLYSYSIDDGVNYYFNGGLFINLAGGTYKTYVKDANGCFSGPVTVVITEPPQLTLSAFSVPGSHVIQGNVAGGTQPYTVTATKGVYTHPPVITNGSFSMLVPSGNPYIVTVTDANNCTSIPTSVSVDAT
jgi:hypothetical protein